MFSFLFALQFLTVIPIKIKRMETNKIVKAMLFFPIVGLLLGLSLIGAGYLFSYFDFAQSSINIILVILLVILTGGLHLDGLSDTFDALCSRKNKEEMLNIMRDSRVGVMGVLAIISIILLKIAFLSSLEVPAKYVALILACILSRWSLVLTMFLFPYAREEGKAKVFTTGINTKIFFWATIITLLLVILLWQIKGLLISLIITFCAYLIGKFIKRQLGGITGDTLGAINELMETITLFSVCFLKRGL